MRLIIVMWLTMLLVPWGRDFLMWYLCLPYTSKLVSEFVTLSVVSLVLKDATCVIVGMLTLLIFDAFVPPPRPFFCEYLTQVA